MKKTRLEHLRNHAHRHHEAHQMLKFLLRHAPAKEKVWHLFLGAFLITLVSVAGMMNWQRIKGMMTPPPSQELPAVQGFYKGVLGTLHIERQSQQHYDQYLQSIPAGLGLTGIKTAHIVAYSEKTPIQTSAALKSALATQKIAYLQKAPQPYVAENLIKTSAWMTHYLSKGKHLTPVREAGNLQKSILATVYFGEKTADITSTLSADTRLLSNMKNTLQIDIFNYLNQGLNRADALDEYLRLLKRLNEAALTRISELEGVVAFLAGNAQGLATRLEAKEDLFFSQLDRLEGPAAEQNLSDFIGLRQNESAVRAKLGAYQTLQDYYRFFQPRLAGLIHEIEINRVVLLAGVRVIEIQNRQLPLIIREQ